MTNETGIPPLESTSESDWPPCGSGEIGSMVRRIRDRRRAQVTARVTGGAAILLAAIAIWQFSGLSENSTAVTDMTCREVMDSLDDYRSGRLDEKKTQQIEAHLADCPHCSEALKKADPEARRFPVAERLISSREPSGNTIALLDSDSRDRPKFRHSNVRPGIVRFLW